MTHRSDADTPDADTPLPGVPVEDWGASRAEPPQPPKYKELPIEPQQRRWWPLALVAVGLIVAVVGVSAAYNVQYYDVEKNVAVISTPKGEYTLVTENGSTHRNNKVTVVDLRPRQVKGTKSVGTSDKPPMAYTADYNVIYGISKEQAINFVKKWETQTKFEGLLRASGDKAIVITSSKSPEKGKGSWLENRGKFSDAFKAALMLELGESPWVDIQSVGVMLAKMHAPDKSNDSQILIVPPGSNINIDTDKTKPKTKTERRHKLNVYKPKSKPRYYVPRRECYWAWDC